ncbi:MAG: hypothetical protein MUC42_08095, partial [Bryobacter sp.]|nr:hypothetical protein [Bryobacter sp.]
MPLRAAERTVGGTVHADGTAVVAQEKHQRVLFVRRFRERFQQAAHAVVHGTEHRGVVAAFLVGDGSEPLQVLLAHLLRRVRGV